MTRPRAYAGLGPLAARLVELHGLRTVIVTGGVAVGEAAIAHPNLEFIGIELDPATPVLSTEPGFRRRMVWRATEDGLGGLTPGVVDSSVVICTLDSESEVRAATLVRLRMLLERSTVAIVAAGDPSPDHPVDLAAALATIGMSPTFLGRAGRLEPRDATVAILDRIVGHQIGRAPAGFRVVAIMSVYNEEDILGPTLQALIDDRIDVYLIDNWSTDRTHQIADTFLGRGLIGIERFPDQPTSVFELSGLLSRVEAIAAGIPSQWFIHHDADERREGPWPGHSLRDALWVADRAGFNAIDHTVLNFRPVDNGFTSGTDYAEYFRRFEFGDTPDLLRQVKAWKDVGAPPSLAASAGHEVTFPGRRIFPYKFELKHYPIRSQTHGERKVILERRGRWDPSERARGWHAHYDAITPTYDFVRNRSELLEFVDGQTQRDHLLPLIAGVGLGRSPVPGWALRGRGWAYVYRFVETLGAARRWLRHSFLPSVPLVRPVAQGLRRISSGVPRVR